MMKSFLLAGAMLFIDPVSFAAEPVWDEWSKWLAEQRPNVLPKSLLGTAVGYASNNWDALKVSTR